MKMLNFAGRNRKEIFRDPLSIVLGIALPLLLLVVFTTIEKNAPLDTFKVENLTPGLIVFSFAFLTMFSALLISKDKQSAFLTRLFASPLTVMDYVFGYALPLIPLALLQGIICFVLAKFLGLSSSLMDISLSILTLLPIALMSIFLGLLLGALFTEKQISGIGTIFITAVSFLGGAWMDISMLGDTFQKVANALPFVHSIQLARDVLAQNFDTFNAHFWWSTGYGALALVIAGLAFVRLCKR
ncbi:ABC transporter permease [Paenibacillus sp. N3/727]|uniref:ABC transporter permease n=1 Tax=Paenibacillus sp. N3/727 TaxID=2925845 RepID=UPI001F5366BB|nr:ABC transporter permease [Paenibacillus sp. N3/727]UNK19558.1 ABC transporter permease [Paenibacillus sp. N3/727]